MTALQVPVRMVLVANSFENMELRLNEKMQALCENGQYRVIECTVTSEQNGSAGPPWKFDIVCHVTHQF